MKRSILFGIFLLCISFYSAHPQAQLPVKIGVQLEINVDGLYQGTIKTTLTNKLRSFNDVSIVESGGIYKLLILGMELHSQAGRVTGIVLSTTVLSIENSYFYKTILGSIGNLNDKQISFLDDFFKNKYFYENSWLQSGPYDNIVPICEEIINKFNADYLEEVRKTISRSILSP
jgi:hypothetical protein